MKHPQEWIGVDLDGTLATYTEWTKWCIFGEPIMPMVERIRKWLDEGKCVKIFTARVPIFKGHDKWIQNIRCYKSNELYSHADMIREIQNWCEKYVRQGWRPHVTCSKDMNMIELWDDRAVGVVTNTGMTLADAALEEERALDGATWR